MQRLLSYIIAGIASAVGWKIGLLLGPVAAYFAALFFAGTMLYLSRRWLATVLD